MMSIPFYDMRSANDACRSGIDAAIARVVDSSWFILGEELKAFEQEFAAYCGASHCVAVNSGTDALWLALLASGVGPGDEVITVANTFVATAIAIRKAGATPVFVDVDESTLLMEPAGVESALTERTRAILPVHLYGRCMDLASTLELASDHGLAVIEDACQAHGARFGGRHAGTWGTAGCFSFYPTKNLGALGDGGAVVTDDPETASKLQGLRNYGESRKYYHDQSGYNSRLDEIQAAILREKLQHLDGWNLERHRLAEMYRERLGGNPQIGLPAPSIYPEHVNYLFVVRVSDREQVQQSLADQGVGTACHYPVAIHLQGAFADLGLTEGTLPASELAADQVLSLPLFPGLTEETIHQVCDALERAVANLAAV